MGCLAIGLATRRVQEVADGGRAVISVDFSAGELTCNIEARDFHNKDSSPWHTVSPEWELISCVGYGNREMINIPVSITNFLF